MFAITSASLDTITLSVDWVRLDKLIAAAADLDDVSAGWGGSGSVVTPIPRKPIALARAFAICRMRMEHAWKRAHDYKIPSTSPKDRSACYPLLQDGTEIAVFATRQEALRSVRARRAAQVRNQIKPSIFTVYGVSRVDPDKHAARISRQTDEARAILRLVLAYGDLYAALCETFESTSGETICGTGSRGLVAVQGPAWWAGAEADSGYHARTTLDAFINGAPLESLL